MRKVATRAVMPRLCILAPHKIMEKALGEIITIVDREVDAQLREGLAALGLGSRIVGEEAAARDPVLFAGIGEGLVWLIGRLDGIANFAEGRAPFGMMVARVEDGEPIGAWFLDLLTGRLCHATRRARYDDLHRIISREVSRQYYGRRRDRRIGSIDMLGGRFLQPGFLCHLRFL